MKPLLPLMFLLLLSGCALGVGYSRPTTVSYTKSEIELDRNSVGYISKAIPDKSSVNHYTKDSIFLLWGKPTNIEKHDNNVEKWIYRHKEMTWQGPIIGILVPIPLTIFPSGHTKTILTFDGESLINVKGRHSRFCYFGYLVMDNGGGWGAFCKDE